MSDEKLLIRKKFPRGFDGYKTFSIRITENTFASIENLAKETGHTRNELIGMLLDYALDHSEVVGDKQ